VTSFDPSISSGMLSPNAVLNYIRESPEIEDRFINASETRHRLDALLMMKTVSRLTNASEAHSKMLFLINTDIVDAGTSWTSALSKLLTSLGDMKRGHIADSISLLNILNDVYSKHVNSLLTRLTTQMEDCVSLTVELEIIFTVGRSISTKSTEFGRLNMLSYKIDYLYEMLSKTDSFLSAEASKSSRGWNYFPNPLQINDCSLVFRSLRDSVDIHYVKSQQFYYYYDFHYDSYIEEITELFDKYSQSGLVGWLDNLIFDIRQNVTFRPTVDDAIFAKMTELRNKMTNLSQCLLSYKKELDSFKDRLDSEWTSTLEAGFNYEPPTTLLPEFSMDGQWLDYITSRYIANSLSKLELATYLRANGSVVLTDADRLYSDIEVSLFSKVSNFIDEQETSAVSFYSDLLQRVAFLQRYMFANDTKLEDFMRRFSIWRMPIVNFQKSQVCCLLLLHNRISVSILQQHGRP